MKTLQKILHVILYPIVVRVYRNKRSILSFYSVHILVADTSTLYRFKVRLQPVFFYDVFFDDPTNYRANRKTREIVKTNQISTKTQSTLNITKPICCHPSLCMHIHIYICAMYTFAIAIGSSPTEGLFCSL